LILHRLLLAPQAYSALARFAGGPARETYVREYVRAKLGDRILDIGCGPADVLDALPSKVEYVGFDSSEKYIRSARARFGGRGRFLCLKLSRDLASQFSGFDLVLANGVIHHLADNEALDLLWVARQALRPGGRLITVDGCRVTGQRGVVRFLLNHDRGHHVRTESAYLALATQVFPNVTSHIRHDLMRIPYTHIIMECQA
jgi:SAM-dependent methyltransferase